VTAGFALRTYGRAARAREMALVTRPRGRVVIHELTPITRTTPSTLAIRTFFQNVVPKLGTLVAGNAEPTLSPGFGHALSVRGLAGRMLRERSPPVGNRKYGIESVAIHWGVSRPRAA